MDVIEAIKTRRSIRKYKSSPVSKDDLNTLLEAARWAPSWANTQCWRLIVVREDDIKKKLARTLFGISDRPNRAAQAIIDAPLTIVACAELERSGYYVREPKAPATDKGDWYMFDVALAMQNLTLAAHSLGLGTVHIGAFDASQAASILRCWTTTSATG